MRKKKLSVLIAAAECSPFVKVGGLGDVVGSLPQQLSKNGVSISVILPKYGSIDKKYKMKKVASGIILDHNRKRETVSVYSTKLRGNPVTYYFIAHPYFNGKEIYIPNTSRKTAGRGSKSDVNRFSLFSHAIVEFIHQQQLNIDILHCQDWHTALVPTYVDQLAVLKNYSFTKTILTIHNLASQGITDRDVLKKMHLRPDTTPYVFEDYYDHDHEQINMMKLGILSADLVSTVSPTYAKEVMTKEYGAGLSTFLERRKKNLYGIVNGIDLQFFNPKTDTFIHKKYTASTYKKDKRINKNYLQKQLGLPERDVPVFGLVSRLVDQKGFDILIPALKKIVKKDMQVVILGTGRDYIEQGLSNLAKQHPEKISATIDFNLSLAQQIYAGSDFFLMPSRFEPCGLGQMIAMRYGTIPVVRATGGLADTVQHNKTGIVFKPYTATALERAFSESISLYKNKRAWYTMADRCFKKDFSWNASAKQYISLYNKIT